MGLPDLQINTPVYQFNLTILLSVIVFCLTAMGTIIKTFGKKPKPEELPGTSPYCQQHKKDVEKLQKFTEDQSNKNQELRSLAGKLEVEVAVLKRDCETKNKSLEEMKENNRTLAIRLDEMIRQLIDYANS